MSSREQVELELGFVLHQRPYRNTSQLVECFTLNHGRVGLVAQGSRRSPKGARALLQAFVPLRLSWLRRGELGRLSKVEAAGPEILLGGERLWSAFYVNELVLRMTARDDANPAAFARYGECLDALAESVSVARALRLFEFGFLEALGYGFDLSRDVQTGAPLDPSKRYSVDFEHGPREIAGAGGYAGRELLSLQQGRLDDEESLTAAKRLLAAALELHLGGSKLKSRDVYKDIVRRGLDA